MNEEAKVVQSGDSGETKLKRVLGTPGLVFFGLAFMNITSILLGYAIVDEMTHGMVPLSILISFVVMLITSFSYKQMSMEYPAPLIPIRRKRSIRMWDFLQDGRFCPLT